MTKQANTQQNFVEGYLAFVKVDKPSLKYQSTTETEFTVDIVVDEDTFDNFGEQFPKQAGKSIKTADFEAKYKFEPPFPDAKKQYILKLKRPGSYKDGNEVSKDLWPKVLVLNSEGTAEPIEEGVLVASGSYGKVSYTINTNDYGSFAKLRNLLIEKLIPYEKKSNDAADDFGVVVKQSGNASQSPVEPAGKPQAASKVQPTKKPAKAAVEPPDESEEDSMEPF